jgi:hypothetical protein
MNTSMLDSSSFNNFFCCQILARGHCCGLVRSANLDSTSSLTLIDLHPQHGRWKQSSHSATHQKPHFTRYFLRHIRRGRSMRTAHRFPFSRSLHGNGPSVDTSKSAFIWSRLQLSCDIHVVVFSLAIKTSENAPGSNKCAQSPRSRLTKQTESERGSFNAIKLLRRDMYFVIRHCQ